MEIITKLNESIATLEKVLKEIGSLSEDAYWYALSHKDDYEAQEREENMDKCYGNVEDAIELLNMAQLNLTF